MSKNMIERGKEEQGREEGEEGLASGRKRDEFFWEEANDSDFHITVAGSFDGINKGLCIFGIIKPDDDNGFTCVLVFFNSINNKVLISDFLDDFLNVFFCYVFLPNDNLYKT